MPAPDTKRNDIIQAIEMGSKRKLVAFFVKVFKNILQLILMQLQNHGICQAMKIKLSWQLVLLYKEASIELSADGPIREPYNVYLQGALTFEHSLVAIMGAGQAVEDLNK